MIKKISNKTIKINVCSLTWLSPPSLTNNNQTWKARRERSYPLTHFYYNIGVHLCQYFSEKFLHNWLFLLRRFIIRLIIAAGFCGLLLLYFTIYRYFAYKKALRFVQNAWIYIQILKKSDFWYNFSLWNPFQSRIIKPKTWYNFWYNLGRKNA